VIGDGVLEISRGGENKPALVAGGNVRFERASGLEQAIVDVKDRIMPILDDLHRTLHDPDGDVRQTLKNLREFSAGMRGTREYLDRVLGSLDTNLNKEAVPLLQSLRKSAANAESLSGKLDYELPVLLNKADTTMENLRQASETLNDAVQGSAPQLPGVVGETRATLDKTQKLIGDTQEAVDTLNTHWPLKSDVPVDNGPVKMDSHD
jgi:phospholipid/cholesterol/gamma-HCH transport system substrate-binding protein